MKSSRQIADVIGMIMIVSTRPAGRIPACDGSPEKIGQEAEHVLEPGLEVISNPRAENEDPPEAEHDARDRREQLHHRGYRRRELLGGDLGEEEGNRDRERRRDREGDQGRDHRSVDEDERPEGLRDRIPGVGPDEAEPEVLDCGPSEVEDLPRDEPQEHRRGQGGRDGDALEEDVA